LTSFEDSQAAANTGVKLQHGVHQLPETRTSNNLAGVICSVGVDDVVNSSFKEEHGVASRCVLLTRYPLVDIVSTTARQEDDDEESFIFNVSVKGIS
jgi:hypothetical protein